MNTFGLRGEREAIAWRLESLPRKDCIVLGQPRDRKNETAEVMPQLATEM
jgi:hypothetical protein